jgi:hypothetical protein
MMDVTRVAVAQKLQNSSGEIIHMQPVPLGASGSVDGDGLGF